MNGVHIKQRMQPDRASRAGVSLVLMAVVLIASLGLTGGVASGQTNETRSSWSVQPATASGADTRPNYTLTLKPGDTVTDYVSVSNLGEQPLTLAVYASDAFNTPQGGFDLLPADQAPVDVGAWVTFNTETVEVPARGSVVVPFTLTVPLNATPGDHVGGIVASRSRPAADGSGNQVLVDYRVGSRVYLRVEGTMAPSLAIEDFKVDYQSAANPISGGDMSITYVVRNTGNVRLSGSQEITVKGPLGLALKTVTLDNMPELLPGAVHDGSVSISGVQPAVRVSAELSLQPIAPADQDVPQLVVVSQSGGVWALPLSIAAIVLAVVGLAVLRLRMRRNTNA